MQAPTLTLVAIGSTIAALVIGLIVFFLHDLATPKPHPQNTRKMDYGTPSADAQHQADVATSAQLRQALERTQSDHASAPIATRMAA